MHHLTALLPFSVIPDPTPVVPDQARGLLTILNWASGIGLVLGVLGRDHRRHRHGHPAPPR